MPAELTETLFTQAEGRIRLFWRILLFLIVGGFVAGMAGILLPYGVQGGSFALLLGGLVGGWIMLALDGRSPDALGFYVTAATGREAILGLGLGVVIALSVVLVMAVLGGLSWSSEAGTLGGWVMGGASAALFLTIPAAAEEVLLRGYPLQALAESMGDSVALVVTAVAFGALHLGNPEVSWLGVVNVTAAGLLLGTVYLKTGSLWWATGVHVGWNWAHGYVADLPVSGMELLDAPFYTGASVGPIWLGGGGFGPEGSAVATVVVLASTAALWWGPWLRYSETASRSRPLALAGRVQAHE